MKIELHAHTSETSPCGHVSARQILSMYKDAGYDCIVITDHYSKWAMSRLKIKTGAAYTEHYLKGYLAAKEAAKEFDITVLLGTELTLNEHPNDYLIYGMTEEFIRSHDLLFELTREEMSKMCHREGFLLIQAHPNRTFCEPVDPALLDGAEIFNGCIRHSNQNEVTEKWAKEHHLLCTSGTDFHELEDVGHGGIETDRTIKTNEDLLELLKSGDYTLIRNV